MFGEASNRVQLFVLICWLVPSCVAQVRDWDRWAGPVSTETSLGQWTERTPKTSGLLMFLWCFLRFFVVAALYLFWTTHHWYVTIDVSLQGCHWGGHGLALLRLAEDLRMIGRRRRSHLCWKRWELPDDSLVRGGRTIRVIFAFLIKQKAFVS